MNPEKALVLPGKPDLPRDLEEAIRELKRQKGAVLLAHYYQESEIQDLADVVGDSLQLARAAQKIDCERDRLLRRPLHGRDREDPEPGPPVVVPDLKAGCSLADGCPADAFEAFIAEHPGAKVLTYINASAAVKAMSDLICTSSNAVKMVEHFKGEQLIFAPDRHLARWVAKETGRTDLIVWPGTCIVHEQFSAKGLAKLRVRASRRRGARASRVRAGRARPGGLHRHDRDHRARREVPGEDADHRDRGRRLPPDPEARAEQDS